MLVLLLFLISCLSVILLSNPLNPFWAIWKAQEFTEMGELLWFLEVGFVSWKSFLNLRPLLLRKKKNEEPKKTEEEAEEKISLLDLPDLPVEYILERLCPSGLCTMAGVCTFFRKNCTNDHFWENHMKQKWGGLIGNVAYQQWQRHIASRKRDIKSSVAQSQKGFLGYFSSFWFDVWNVEKSNEVRNKMKSCLPADSIMAWYLAIETGKFWFPAQVYNRENGHVGFMLSCYDAQVSYDSKTDTFVARYTANGRRTIEDNIGWNRLRAPATSTCANVIHISDCLNDLKPGNQIEIQWRRNKEFPYGWWYALVGHLESCNDNESHCLCTLSDTVVLEFKQYAVGSRWRQTVISRKEHREVGNGGDGFYGGIRKLINETEISTWKTLCQPTPWIE